jgi:NADH dehydrogenase
MTAVVALQSGRQAAVNILRIIRGEAPAQFAFKDLGTLATIGRNAAVGQIGALQISGMLAWLLWTFIHIWRLVGFRNRIFVFWRWFWDYIFFDRSVRLITRE